MIQKTISEDFISFYKRLYQQSKGFLVFMILITFISLIYGKGLWVILVVMAIKIPTAIKRARFHLIYIRESKDFLRLVFLDYNKLKNFLIEKNQIKVSITQYQSRDVGYYLDFSKGNQRLFRISDSFGWTLFDFLIIVKRINRQVPNNWYLKEKSVKEYMSRNHPKANFSWEELEEMNSRK